MCYLCLHALTKTPHVTYSRNQYSESERVRQAKINAATKQNQATVSTRARLRSKKRRNPSTKRLLASSDHQPFCVLNIVLANHSIWFIVSADPIRSELITFEDPGPLWMQFRPPLRGAGVTQTVVLNFAFWAKATPPLKKIPFDKQKCCTISLT